MKLFYQVRLGFIGALALAGTSYAQVPRTNDTSTTGDHENTGMGTGAPWDPPTRVAVPETRLQEPIRSFPTPGSNNIDIDNQGETGDTDTIRIGTEGTQKNTSIAGIYDNTGVTGYYVVVDATGQLGRLTTPPPTGAVKATYAPRIRRELQRQAAEIRDLRQQVAELQDLKQQVAVLSAVLPNLQTKDEVVAQR